MTDLCSPRRLTAGRRPGRHHQRRIEIVAAPFHPPAPVRAGGSPRHVDPAGQGQARVILRPCRAGRDQGTGADDETPAVQDHATWPSRWKASFGPA